MIFDTTFVIDLMLNEPAAYARAQELSEKRESSFITLLSVFELFSGLGRSSKYLREKIKIATVLGRYPLLALERPTAELAGELHGELIKEGNRIGALDCMIAAIALTRHEPVLTRNVDHFRRIKGLMVETY